MQQTKVENLKPGDLIYVAWSDAWEADKVPLKNGEYDVVWHEWGLELHSYSRRLDLEGRPGATWFSAKDSAGTG